MIHKVLNHGAKGNPFAYLLKKDRAIAAEVVRGDPELCWATIRALPYRQKYTSLVLSFAERVTAEREGKILEDYERVAFGGRAEEFARVWVRHREHDRTELHLVVANVHLPTGKRWSHYYDRADRQLFKSWQELTNLRYGLASPDAPERKRLADMPGKLPDEKKALFEKLDALVCAGVARGEIQTRADLLKALELAGYEARPSRNYVAVKCPGADEKALRLRGKKYNEDFSREALLASAASRNAEDDEARKRRYEQEFAEAMARRAAFVERVCRPRRPTRQKPPVSMQSMPEVALARKLTTPPEAARHAPIRSQPETDHESRLGTDLSTSVWRADAAGGRALLAARTATWRARIADACRRIAGALRALCAAATHGEWRAPVMGVPLVSRESLCLGRRRFADLPGGRRRRERSGPALPGRSDREPAPVVGRAGREDRERDWSPGIPL